MRLGKRRQNGALQTARTALGDLHKVADTLRDPWASQGLLTALLLVAFVAALTAALVFHTLAELSR